MKPEIEAKFLDVDPDAIRAELKKLGASLVFPEHLTRQKVFDYPDFRLDKDFSWLRLREENGRITLTLKKWKKDGGVDGMGEIAFGVGPVESPAGELYGADSFEDAEELLLAIGLGVKSSQMKKRELWKLGDVECMIDTWPWIPSFLEIEGKTEKDVRDAVDSLHLKWENAIFGGVAGIYRLYFDIDYKEIDRCSEITFSAVPGWLEAKRIQNRGISQK